MKDQVLKIMGNSFEIMFLLKRSFNNDVTLDSWHLFDRFISTLLLVLLTQN
jgi:hypothetical protein